MELTDFYIIDSLKFFDNDRFYISFYILSDIRYAPLLFAANASAIIFYQNIRNDFFD